MEQSKTQTTLPAVVAAKETFIEACKQANDLQIVNNFGAAFQAVEIVSMLRAALTDEVMDAVFMPLMNTKIGFLTDHTGKTDKRGYKKEPYSREIVRDAIIDAVSVGLLPTGNQFNIIAEKMYPTKEGYTALLRKLGVKYYIDVSYDKSQTQGYAEIPCRITYQYNGEKNSFSIVATVKKDDYSSHDQMRGKAERRAKKALFEYLTGCDFGDADEDSSRTIEAESRVVKKSTPEQIERVAVIQSAMSKTHSSAREQAQAIHKRFNEEHEAEASAVVDTETGELFPENPEA